MYRGTYSARAARALRDELGLSYQLAAAVNNAHNTLHLWRSEATATLDARLKALLWNTERRLPLTETRMTVLIERLSIDFLPYAAGLRPFAKRFAPLFGVLGALGADRARLRELRDVWEHCPATLQRPPRETLADLCERATACADRQTELMLADRPCEPEPLAALAKMIAYAVRELVDVIERGSDVLLALIVESEYSLRLEEVVMPPWEQMADQVALMWHCTLRLESCAHALAGTREPAAEPQPKRHRLLYSLMDREERADCPREQWSSVERRRSDAAPPAG